MGMTYKPPKIEREQKAILEGYLTVKSGMGMCKHTYVEN